LRACFGRKIRPRPVLVNRPYNNPADYQGVAGFIAEEVIPSRHHETLIPQNQNKA
jgi:hypothetical protein